MKIQFCTTLPCLGAINYLVILSACVTNGGYVPQHFLHRSFPQPSISSNEWHTENYNSIHANKLVNQIAANDNQTVIVAPITCLRDKHSCHEQQCCFGQRACCKSTGVCGCKDPGDMNSHSCPFDIATTSISSSASSSEKSVVTNACIQTISKTPPTQPGRGYGESMGTRGGRSSKYSRPTRNVASQPVISYEVTPDGDLNGFVRTAATGNAYVLTTTTTANFGPVRRFLQEFSADELMEYLEEETIEDLLMINGCRRWQIFR